jgi:hypothetical protein
MTASENATSAMSRSASPDLEEQFAADIELWTRQALAEGAGSYTQLLGALPGVDPVLLAPVLEALCGHRAVGDVARRLAAESRVSSHEPLTATERPVPHPLEYYWANDRASLDFLANELGDTTQPGDRVVYLGAPNIWRHGAVRLPDRRHVLLDRSRRRTDALAGSVSGDVAIICMDVLADELPDVSARVVVMDPPWYTEHLKSFLWAGAALAVDGGALLSSYPPLGTRPGMSAERAQFLSWANGAGLRLVRDEPGVLRYVSPAFERSAYAAAGLPGVPSVWRCGDLLTFATNSPTVPRPGVSNREEWSQYSIREIPICVRHHPSPRDGVPRVSASPPLLESLVDGDVLPSVSRRDPLRAAVSVWSSRNRVFGTGNQPAVHAICAALENGQDPVSALSAQTGRPVAPIEAENVRSVAERLLRLVNLEREEHMLA